MSTPGSYPSSGSGGRSSSLWRWQREHLLLHHADAAALVGWAIGLRWAAAAADAFLNAATAAAVAVAADGANAEATGRSVTAAEAATLRLLGACLAGPPPDALRSTAAAGRASKHGRRRRLFAAEDAQH